MYGDPFEEILREFDLEGLVELLEQLSSGAMSLSSLINTILSLGSIGIGILIAIITAIISFVTWLVMYILGGIPLYSIAKKTKTEGAILAWMPIFTSYFRTYLLAKVPGNKPFELFDKKIESRSNAFWIFLGIKLAGPTLITIAIGIMSVIPIAGLVAGSFTSLLYLVPPAASAVMEYVFLKDVLDIFKEDKKSNNTTAIVITVLDSIITGGLAQTVYLYSLVKKSPLPSQRVDA